MATTSAVAPPSGRHCQGFRVGSGDPCRIRKHLNANGYCKYHEPTALQCLGTASSTGQRCRIKWDLNGDQLCQFHKNQAGKVCKEKGEKSLPAKEDKPAKQKVGTEKPAKPTTPQCRGIAKKTGQRCLISWNLNSDELCEYHHRQVPKIPKVGKTEEADQTRETPAAPVRVATVASRGGGQCRGVARSTGVRCQITWNLDANKYCHHHGNQAIRARI